MLRLYLDRNHVTFGNYRVANQSLPQGLVQTMFVVEFYVYNLQMQRTDLY